MAQLFPIWSSLAGISLIPQLAIMVLRMATSGAARLVKLSCIPLTLPRDPRGLSQGSQEETAHRPQCMLLSTGIDGSSWLPMDSVFCLSTSTGHVGSPWLHHGFKLFCYHLTLVISHGSSMHGLKLVCSPLALHGGPHGSSWLPQG